MISSAVVTLTNCTSSGIVSSREYDALGRQVAMSLSSHESPRSGVNVSGLRPSLIAKHSLRGALGIILSPAQGEGCFSVINDGRSPGKTPSLRGDSRVVLPGFACDYFNDCAVPSFVASFVLSFVDS